MNSKTKGNKGEIAVLWEFTKRDIPCALPVGDNERYDLIAEFNGKLNKIQVKYCGYVANGSIEIPCCSKANYNTVHETKSYIKDVDYIAAYLEQLDKCVLIPIEDIGNKTTMKLRFEESKNNQSKGVTWWDKYTFDEILKKK